MSIFDKLKDLASNSVDVMKRTSDLFPPLDVDYVRRDTKLTEKGKENGLANLPRSNAQTQDSVELDIKSRIEEIRDRYQRDYDLELDAYKGRIASYTNILDIQGIGTEFEAKLGNIEKDFKVRTGSLFLEAQQLKDRGEHVRVFRNQNALEDRLPDYPKDSFRAWRVIVVLALAELALNFFLLRESGEVLTVGVQSLLYGLVNVIIPFALFAHILRYINHIKPVYVNFGYLFIAFYVIYTLFINLLIAHYRGVSMEVAVEIGQAVNAANLNQGLMDRYLEVSSSAFSSFKNNWFGLKDIWSALLFLGGCGLSLLAMREGYISDDKYPGYGELHRNYVSDFEKFLDASEETIDSLTEERDRAVEELRNDITNLENSHTRIPTVIQTATSLRGRCNMALDSLNTYYNMLLKEYRGENLKHRTEPEPNLFDQEFKLDKPELSSFEVGDIKEPSDVIRELHECSMRLHEVYAQKIGELESTRDLLKDSPFKVVVN
jgi:hypothetical protein